MTSADTAANGAASSVPTIAPLVAVTPRNTRREVHGVPLPLPAEVLAQILPHRGAFALVDRVTEIDPGRSATGLKLVSRTDPVLEGHFPGRPIVPGVLLIETLGQLCGVVLWSAPRSGENSLPGSDGAMGVLAGVKRFRFRRLVEPGDVVTLHARLTARAGALVEFEVVASVNRDRAAEGTVQIGFRTEPPPGGATPVRSPAADAATTAPHGADEEVRTW